MVTAEADFDIEATPDYWLILLLRALRQSDLDLAAEAQRHLHDIGIEVQFARLLEEGADADV
jgi:hypothetical protein